jgi:hypothetical protein
MMGGLTGKETHLDAPNTLLKPHVSFLSKLGRARLWSFFAGVGDTRRLPEVTLQSARSRSDAKGEC